MDFLGFVSSESRDETILPRHETISRFGADIRKRRMVITLATKRRTASAARPGDSPMKTLSFVLAFAFLLLSPSMAGSADRGLPGIGTFAYNGSPIAISAPQPIVVATR
jgi:hypothetical protein